MVGIDGDDVDWPTIKEELRAMGQIPDGQDDMGDATLLFGVAPTAALILDGAAPAAPDAAIALSLAMQLLWHHPPSTVSTDLLSGLTLMKLGRLLMVSNALLLFASSISLIYLVLLLMALDIYLDITNHARRSVIMLI